MSEPVAKPSGGPADGAKLFLGIESGATFLRFSAALRSRGRLLRASMLVAGFLNSGCLPLKTTATRPSRSHSHHLPASSSKRHARPSKPGKKVPVLSVLNVRGRYLKSRFGLGGPLPPRPDIRGSVGRGSGVVSAQLFAF